MSAVSVGVDGAVCTLALNRPDKLNALDADVYLGLRVELERLSEDPRTSVVVITGTGRAFSAGVDIAALATVRPAGGDSQAGWAQRRHAMGSWQRLLDLLERIPQVTVAAVQGHCVGGAALLAVSCDLRIGADDLQVRIPELAIGIPLTWGGVPRLVRELGLPLARDLVMTGRVLDGPSALAAGFVQRLVGRQELEAATTALVGEVLAMPPGPMAVTRAMFSAIGRDRLGPASWADPDILGWSGSEAESREAGGRYASRTVGGERLPD